MTNLKLSAVLVLLSVHFTSALHIISQPTVVRASHARTCGQPQMSASEERIKEMVESNKIMLFMKGNKMFPQCGFSNTAVQILNAIEAPYETFDVLSDQDVREGVKKCAASILFIPFLPACYWRSAWYSNWPTIPQCYVEGEFIGGCDIMIEMYQSGELQEMLERVAAS